MTKPGSTMPVRMWTIIFTAPDGSIRVIDKAGRNLPSKWAMRQAKPGEAVKIWEGSKESLAENDETSASVEGEQ